MWDKEGLITEKGTSLTRSFESSRIGKTKLKLFGLVSAILCSCVLLMLLLAWFILMWLLSSSSRIESYFSPITTDGKPSADATRLFIALRSHHVLCDIACFTYDVVHSVTTENSGALSTFMLRCSGSLCVPHHSAPTQNSGAA